MIEVRNLRKSFGQTVALDGITFTVPQGEVLGFLGPNAAGKTTTMRILACFLPADSGTATVAGYDVATQSVEVRRRIGYLPENNPLYLDMEVLEYLRFIAAIRGIPRSHRSARLDDMVELCGLNRVVGRLIGNLSKGYRQRVGLAQSLMHEPEILILDEPTTGLDPNQIVEIRELIRRIGTEKTIMLSSHILSEVRATCERILIVSDGRLVGSGTPEELARQARGGDALHLLVRASEEDLREFLPAVRGVAGVRTGDGEDDARRVVLTVAHGADPREEIFTMAVERRWVILEMYREAASLEDVFRSLTAGEGQDA